MTHLLLGVALTLALALSACGKRGNLERPEGAAQEYPRVYPPSR